MIRPSPQHPAPPRSSLNLLHAPLAKIGKEGGAPHRKRPIPPPDRPPDERRTKKRKAKAEMSSEQPPVRASHILIKHEGSRRKASWKDPDGLIIGATTRDAAAAQLRALREDIVASRARFEDVAFRVSDCSSAKRGGDLGRFGRGQMQKPFEEVAFALKVGEISDIVDTDSGVHIILRTG